ncbi:MAG: isoprenyl transferase [Clostridia bacterium]|nr:isoprenyl transferase [Bacillota bacterium]MBO2520347.1 isoprenyl transferase [Bacillota bacterium]
MLKELFRNGYGRDHSAFPEEQLEAMIQRDRLPKHVAIIMDGNGRWAMRRGMPRLAGHRQGVDALREVTRACGELGIGILTVYAFSTENWQRPKEEVEYLLNLLDEVLEKELPELHAHGVKVRVIGRRASLSPQLVKKIEAAEALTASNQKLLLNVGFNYGGRAEIVDAVKRAVELARAGRLDVDDIDEEWLSGAMYTAGIPDPDLLIRTGGEARVSNFLLWQLAYAEIWFTPVCWPDFRRRHLLEAVVDFQQRERKFGRV